MPAITVLMSCYNASRYLREAIESILGQAYTDFEFLLVNDGSSDDTLHIMKEYASADKRIVIIDKENTGLPDSLNLGLEMARGEWIARMDADDIALSERFAIQIDFLKHHTDVVALGGNAWIIDAASCRTGRLCQPPTEHEDIIANILFEKRGIHLIHPTVLFRRDAAANCGGYRRQFVAGQDADMWLRFARHGAVRAIHEPILFLRKHTASISAQKRPFQIVHRIAAVVCHMVQCQAGIDPIEQSEQGYEEILRLATVAIAERQLIQREKLFAQFTKHVRRRSVSSLARAVSIAMRDPSCLLAFRQHNECRAICKIIAHTLLEQRL